MNRELSRSAFLKRVRDTVRHYDMLRKGDRVMAAVSGGADSVCLLRSLLDIRRELGIEVIVANLDHGLRGAESEKDSEFVKRLSEDIGLECVHKKVSLGSGGKRGSSVEERAREKRYAFLIESAAAKGCGAIATGHTMDDQAETVLLRFIHGSSLAGITGIPPVRHEGDLRIIRPLIRVERRDILSFLKKEGLEHVEDSSNLDMRFSRNRVRHEILPFLEKYNPRLKRSLVNLSDTLREDHLFIRTEKEKALSKHAGGEIGPVAIKIKDMILQPRALRKEIFKELFRRAGGNVKALTYRHWMDMDYFLRAGNKGAALDFPGGIRVTRTRGEVVFGRCCSA